MADGIIKTHITAFKTLGGTLTASAAGSLAVYTTGDGNLKVIDENGAVNNLAYDAAVENTIIELVDNTAPAFRFKEGSNTYLRFQTTNGDEQIHVGNTIATSTTGIAGGTTFVSAVTAGLDLYGATSAKLRTTGTGDVEIYAVSGEVKIGGDATTGDVKIAGAGARDVYIGSATLGELKATAGNTILELDADDTTYLQVADDKNFELKTQSAENILKYTATAGAERINIGDVSVTGTQVHFPVSGANAVQIAGGLSVDGACALDAVTVDTSDASFQVTGSNAFDVNVTGAISLDADAASNLNCSVGDLTLHSEAGSVILQGAEAAADAVRIYASNAAGGIDVDCGSAGFNFLSTGASSIQTSAGDLVLDSQAASLVLDGGQAASDAVRIIASHTDGGIDVDAGTAGVNVLATGASIFKTTAGNLTVDSNAGQLILEGGVAAANAIHINTTDVAGGLDVDVGTGGVNMATSGTFVLASTNVDIDAAGAVQLLDNQFVHFGDTNVSIKGNTTTTDFLELRTGNTARVIVKDASTQITNPLISGTPVVSTNGTPAISVAAPLAYIDSSGGVTTLTIADGVNGQILMVVMTVAGNAATLGSTNLNGTSLVFDAVGEAATMVFDSTTSKWSVVGATATYTP